MKRYKKGNAAPNKAKSMKMGADELGEMIKAAVKEALGEGDEAKEDTEDVVAGGDLMDIVTDAIAAATEKRKSRKESGEEVGDDPTEDILAEVEAIVASLEDEEKEDDEDDEEKEDEPDGDEKSAKRKMQTKTRTKSRSSAPAPAQRKYGDIYVPVASARSRLPRVAASRVRIPEVF